MVDPVPQLESLPLEKGTSVLLRADFNVPLRDGKIDDDLRITAALPTIHWLLERDCKIVACSHLGRPKGKVDPKYSLAPVAARLGELLGSDVELSPGVADFDSIERAQELDCGRVLLLENLRFYAEEEANDPAFAKKLAGLCQIYVNDAFGSAHRAHASTEGITHFAQRAVAGLLMEKELNYLGKALTNPAKPFVAILGGAKVSDKIEVIENLLTKVDAILIGGGMAYTFLKAQGLEVGKSLVETDKLDIARQVMASAKSGNVRFLLPVDHVLANRFAPDAKTKIVGGNEPFPAEWMALDIGPKTVDLFAGEIAEASTIVWNGPMGVFEMQPFAHGTTAIAELVAANRDAVSIVGGGDSVSAIKQAGVTDRITHISTGGGASLEFLEGKVLPGVDALLKKP